MTSSQDPRPARGETDAAQDDAAGLAEMLSGLLGGGAREGEGGAAAPLQALLRQLGGGQQAETETEGLTPELLRSLEKTPATGAAASPIPDAVKRAAEALGVPPALVEKLLPGILGQLPALGQAAPQAPAGDAVHKRPAETVEAPAKPRKPRASSAKPAESAGARKPKASGSASAKKPKATEATPKSGKARKPSSSSKPRSSGNSGSTSRRKPKTEPVVAGLEDIIKALVK